LGKKEEKENPICSGVFPKQTNSFTKTTKINNKKNTNSDFDIKTPNGSSQGKWKEKKRGAHP